MNAMPEVSKEYLRNAVMTASPEQLHLMLLDGAIRFATRGIEAIQAKDIEGTFNALDRAQRIVLELTNGLQRDVNPELVDRMSALYAFIFRRLVEGNLHRDVQAIEDALRILRHQRETWALLIEKLKQEVPQRFNGATAPAEFAPPPDSPGEAAGGFVAEA